MNQSNREYLALIEEAVSENTSGDRLKELAALNNELAEIVASNVAAPPGLLTELVSYTSKAVRKAVTSNPNTPIKTLFKLGEHFPQELLDNPAFELLYLDNSNFVINIPIQLLLILIQYQNTPTFILNSNVRMN